jgi:hypothetical protein
VVSVFAYTAAGKASEDGPTGSYFLFSASGSSSSGGGATSLTVKYTLGGTATKDVDYNGPLTSGTVSVTVGTPVYVSYTAIPDLKVEPTETVVPSITDDASYTVGTRTATNTVEDAVPEVTIHADTTVGEGGIGSATMTVRRNKAVDKAVTVSVTPAGTAGLNRDYTLEGLDPGWRITIPASAAEAQFRVIPKDDEVIEKPETVRLSIGIVTDGHRLADPRVATVTIKDDDGGDKPRPGDVFEDPDEAEPNAWVDVSLGGWGYWWYDGWPGVEGEQPYGSTEEGEGLTTGALLHLNRDYDESPGHQGEVPPPKDLAKAGIVPWDGEVSSLWLGAWTDDGSEEAAANSVWTLTWDDSKVNVYEPEYDDQDNLIQSIHQYNAAGALPTSRWINSPDTTIQTGRTTSNVTLLWGEGGNALSKAWYLVNNDYQWDLDVNVVRIAIKAGPTNVITYGNPPVQDPGTSNLINSVAAGGGNAMTAKLTVEITAPFVGGRTRGAKFMQMGFLQDAQYTAMHADFNALPKVGAAGLGRRRVSNLQDGNFHMDQIQGSIAPWYDTLGKGYLALGVDANWGERDFEVVDWPQAVPTDLMSLTEGGVTDGVDHFAILDHFRLYFGVRTIDPRNNADTIYTQRATANWLFDGSGSVAGGVWSKTGVGNNGPASLAEVRSGAVCPETTGTPWYVLLRTQTFSTVNKP